MEADEETPIAGPRSESTTPWRRMRAWASASGLTWYTAYVVAVLALAHVSDDMDRLVIGVVTIPLSQALGYGDQSCLVDAAVQESPYERYCGTATDNVTCAEVIFNQTQRSVCEWNFNGGGIDYEILVGPVFYVSFTVAAIAIGLVADVTRRACLLGITSSTWALFTLLSGTVSSYWQLLLLRLLVAAFEGSCTPLSTSLLGDYVPDGLLATALGIYNWGTDVGYGLAFIVGNYAVASNLGGEGWRWAFYICGIPGIILGFIILISVREPARRQRPFETDDDVVESASCGVCERLTSTMCLAMSHFLTWDVFPLCLATAIRKGATYSYVYNIQLFYQLLGETETTIGWYICWINMVGGFVGLVMGGYLTDRLSIGGGTSRRLLIVILCQLFAIPFATASLLVDTPLSFYMLLLYYMVGEVWLGVSYAALVELIPSAQKTTIVALFVFVVENMAGLGPVLVTLIQSVFLGNGFPAPEALRYALVFTFPGGIAISLVVYTISCLAIRLSKQT